MQYNNLYTHVMIIIYSKQTLLMLRVENVGVLVARRDKLRKTTLSNMKQYWCWVMKMSVR